MGNNKRQQQQQQISTRAVRQRVRDGGGKGVRRPGRLPGEEEWEDGEDDDKPEAAEVEGNQDDPDASGEKPSPPLKNRHQVMVKILHRSFLKNRHPVMVKILHRSFLQNHHPSGVKNHHPAGVKNHHRAKITIPHLRYIPSTRSPKCQTTTTTIIGGTTELMTGRRGEKTWRNASNASKKMKTENDILRPSHRCPQDQSFNS